MRKSNLLLIFFLSCHPSVPKQSDICGTICDKFAHLNCTPLDQWSLANPDSCQDNCGAILMGEGPDLHIKCYSGVEDCDELKQCENE